MDDPHRAGAMVIVLGAVESEIRSGIPVVEVAHGANRRKPREVKASWMAPVLPAHPRPQSADEIPLVDEVLSPFERVDALGQLHHGGDRAHAAQLRWRSVSVITGQLQGDIAAERIPCNDEALDAFRSHELPHDVIGIVRET